ncbi:Hypothetical protein R9X50_00154500 [Acrodontium crateriforme]|uniref:Methionine synthase n=1 Tax=Acrodontium crateriforme TaxID=150365 RepID=A0AAQ3LZ75_9PEZI|nr:Hypothetical protein R9X50_00154500 [Acrodontium crateriforme]
MPHIHGCHLVGSVPLPDSEAVFRQCSQGMPNRLKRIPDGETGARHWFTFWQANVFSRSPELLTNFVLNSPLEARHFTAEELDQGMAKLTADGPLQTGYDDVAIENYAVFKKLRQEGVLPTTTKFQVCIPTAANVITPFVQFEFQSRVEPVYEEALHKAMRKIQDHIPHEDLSIQIDLAVDTAFWEGVDMYKPWFGDDVKTYILNYILKMIDQVDQDVDLGLHNCYGDMEHKHWKEPTSLAAVVERGLRIIEKTSHPLNFFHCPVPKSALSTLPAYLEPLKTIAPKLKEHNTELYLGLIHADDAEATRKMMDAANHVVDEYGVATECGWGRTPLDQLESIMAISTGVSEPSI